MTYKQFSDKQKQILDECRSLLNNSEFARFNDRMNDLIALQDLYLKQRGVK